MRPMLMTANQTMARLGSSKSAPVYGTHSHSTTPVVVETGQSPVSMFLAGCRFDIRSTAVRHIPAPAPPRDPIPDFTVCPGFSGVTSPTCSGARGAGVILEDMRWVDREDRMATALPQMGCRA